MTSRFTREQLDKFNSMDDDGASVRKTKILTEAKTVRVNTDLPWTPEQISSFDTFLTKNAPDLYTYFKTHYQGGITQSEWFQALRAIGFMRIMEYERKHGIQSSSENMDDKITELDDMLATTEVIGQINSEPPSPERSIEAQIVSKKDANFDITAWVKDYAEEYGKRVKVRQIIEYNFEGIGVWSKLLGKMTENMSFDRVDMNKFVFPVTKELTLAGWETLRAMNLGEMTLALGEEYNVPAYDAWSIATNAEKYQPGTMPRTLTGPLPESLRDLTNSFFLTGLALGAVIGLSQGSFDSPKFPSYVSERLITEFGGVNAKHEDIRRLVSVAKGVEVPSYVFQLVCLVPGALERTKMAYAGQAYTGMLHETTARELQTLKAIDNWRDAIIFLAARKYTLLSPVWGKSNPFNNILTGKRNLKLAILCVRASRISEPVTMKSLEYSSCATRLKEGVVDMYAKVPESSGEALVPLAKKLFELVRKKVRSPHLLDNFVDDCKDHYDELAAEIISDMISIK